MKCDFCDNDANVEIVVFINGKAQKVRMCSSCYQKKLAEMMGQLPKEWGGKELTDQIRSMLEKAQEGGFMPGMEVSFSAIRYAECASHGGRCRFGRGIRRRCQ